ncbi:uncharacterized protein LOC110021748 [Phalaenopsis equestris]|uniref:uncharacterized protein LOC110021748 n=1 Tax=Phalaenopsis equestris TaxID=78828 RepID=UPI0009E1A28E|nr:uncharacterized protein LOC110021748 [Phalaenopsis equestris]
MGSSASTASTPVQSPTAMVIDADGSLFEYSHPVAVYHILDLNRRTFFLSDADELLYGHQVQALEHNHLIQLGKIYFLLPEKMQNHVLTAGEMAALAASASSAIASAGLRSKKSGGDGRRRGKKGGVQVMPIIAAMESEGYERFNENRVGSWRTERGGEVKQRDLGRGKSGIKGTFMPRLSSIEEVCD